MDFAQILAQNAVFVGKYPAVTVAELDHQFKMEEYVKRFVQQTGGCKLTAVVWEVLDGIVACGEKAHWTFSSPALRALNLLEDFFFKLMLMQFQPNSCCSIVQGSVAWRLQRYFGLA